MDHMPLHDNFAARVSLALLQEKETPATKSEDVLRVCSCHGNEGPEWKSWKSECLLLL